MNQMIDADGRVVDQELNELGRTIQAGVNKLFTARTEWTLEQKMAAAFHLQSYISVEATRCVLENLMKKQQGVMPRAQATVRPIHPTAHDQADH